MIAADGVKKPSMRNVDVDIDGDIDVGIDDDVGVDVDVGVNVYHKASFSITRATIFISQKL